MKLNFSFWIIISSIASITYAAPQLQTSDLALTSSVIITSSSSTLPTPTTSSSSVTSKDACAELASIARQSPQRTPTVPASAAWDCLQAIPLDKTTAEAWVRSLQPYIRWQTTIAYLKSPPADYQLPPYDLTAKYDEILSKAQNGSYVNQYDFELAIFRLFQQTHDDHFYYEPNLVRRVIRFGRPFALVSISSDGQELPRPYVYSDVLLSYNVSSFEPSAITEIDGQPVTEYLEKSSLNNSHQDRDSLWNSLFLELAELQLGSGGQGSGFFVGGGTGDVFYPGATTNLTFENGTSRVYQNVARLVVPFSNITSAQDLYRRYVNLTEVPRLPSSSGSLLSSPGPGYPPAIIRDQYNLAGGYYLNDTGYEDVAILSLSSFLSIPNLIQSPTAFTFPDRAKADNKTKLIIDLSANGGGSIALQFAVFNKLFPNIVPYMGTRFRATETFDIIGQTISDWSNGTSDLVYNPNNTWLSIFFGGFTPFPYASDIDENYKPFPSWQAKFGPHEYHGDNFTSIIQTNLSQTAALFNGSSIKVNNASQPLFAPENIIILTDGFCASACSNFVEMMTQQAGVKTVVAGGRPHRNPIQAVGGTRGSNVYTFTAVLQLANSTYELVRTTKPASEAANIFSNTQLGEYIGSLGVDPRLPFKRAGGALNSGINVRDNIRKDDQEQTPLQFVYEPADCRIFWTKDMTVDITALWKEVVDVTWGDGECVAGSIQGNDSSRKVKRSSSAERIQRRSLQRREITSGELDALAEGAGIWSDQKLYRSQDWL